MKKTKIINKVISEEVNKKILEVGTITASNWDGVCISYEFNYIKQEIIFVCNDNKYGEEFYLSITFEDLEKEYNIEIVECSTENINLTDLTHGKIFETVIDTIAQKGCIPVNINYCLISEESFVNAKLNSSYFDNEYRDLMFKLNYGSSEGIYLDVYILDSKLRKLATIKSLSETKLGLEQMGLFQVDIIVGYNEMLKQIRRGL